MFDRYWREHRPLIGSGIVVVLMVLGAVLLSPSQPQQEYKPDRETSAEIQSAVDHPFRVLPIAEAACAEAAQSGDEDGAQHDKRDLCAQFRSAKAAEAQVLVGGVGLFFILFTLCLTAVSTFAAIKSVNETRRIGQAQTKAFLSVPGGRLDFVFAKQDISDTAMLFVEVQNSGNSPAKNVEVEVWIRVVPNQPRYSIWEIQDRYLGVVSLQDIVAGTSTEAHWLWWWDVLEPEMRKKENRSSNLVRRGHARFLVKGNVRYRTIFDEDVVQPYFLWVNRFDPSTKEAKLHRYQKIREAYDLTWPRPPYPRPTHDGWDVR